MIRDRVSEQDQVGRLVNPIVNAKMQHWSYTEEQGELLRVFLAEIGPGRVRGNWAAAADLISEIGVVVEWVGIALAAGFVGEAGADFYRFLRQKLKEYVETARLRFENRARLSQIRLQYADVDVIIQLPVDEEVPDLGAIVGMVADRLATGRLREVHVVEVFMPMTYYGEYEKWLPDYTPASADGYGVWEVTGIDAQVVQHPYDAVNDEWLTPLPPWSE